MLTSSLGVVQEKTLIFLQNLFKRRKQEGTDEVEEGRGTLEDLGKWAGDEIVSHAIQLLNSERDLPSASCKMCLYLLANLVQQGKTNPEEERGVCLSTAWGEEGGVGDRQRRGGKRER
jgi:hypothetical protein